MINSEKNANENNNEKTIYKENQLSQKKNVVSVIRIRPWNKQETEFSNIDILKIPNNNLINIIHPIEYDQTEKGAYYIRDLRNVEIVKSNEYQYCFDKICSEGASQEEVYSFTSYLLHNIINGLNSTIMAYGATGTGKTYTIVGSGHQPGIMTRSISDLFMLLNSKETHTPFKVRMVYVELYNELILDLLSDQVNSKNNNLPIANIVEIKTDPHTGLTFSNTAIKEITNVSEAMQLLLKGNKKRTADSTIDNDKSSRSHGILQITVERDTLVDNKSTYSKLLLLDLAGNEKIMTASILKNKEGTSINKSLLALGKCINVLIGSKSNHAFLSWRDSKLTQILKESLSGNSAIIIIGTISSNIVSIDETTSTLKFVNKAMQIKLNQKMNEIESTIIQKYEKAIEELHNEISVLKVKIVQKKYAFDHTPDEPLNQIEYCPELDIQLNNMKKHFEKEIELKKDILAKEKEVVELNYESNEIKALAVTGDDNNIKKKLLSIEDKKKQIDAINNQLNEFYAIQARLLIERTAYQQLINSISNEDNYDDNDNIIKIRVSRTYRQCFMNLYHYYLAQMRYMNIEFNNDISKYDYKIKDKTIALLLDQLEIRDNAVRTAHFDIISTKGALHEQEFYESVQEMRLNPCRLPIIDTGVIKLKQKIKKEINKGDIDSINSKRQNEGFLNLSSPMLPNNINTNFKAKFYQINPPSRIKKAFKLNNSRSTSTVIQRINKDIFINNKLILKHDSSNLNNHNVNTNKTNNQMKTKVKTLFKNDGIVKQKQNLNDSILG